MDPALYAILMLSAAGAAVLIGGWLASRRHR
jgi:hypothetical protein